MTFRLETERLVIRPWVPEDRAAFHALTLDPETMHHVHGRHPYREDEVEEWLTRQARQLAEHDVCMGAMVEKATGRIIGVAGTQPLGTTGDLEIGWWLASDVWGRGFATEAGRAAMHHVLDTLQRPKVVAVISPENYPSKRVVGRLGMEYDRRYTGAELGHRKPELILDLYYRMRG